jgi:hypothetical protein
MCMLIDCMYVYFYLIIFVFVLTSRVFIRLFITLMLLEGVSIIHRRPIGVSKVIDPHFRHNTGIYCSSDAVDTVYLV